jgi:hypothetical protein
MYIHINRSIYLSTFSLKRYETNLVSALVGLSQQPTGSSLSGSHSIEDGDDGDDDNDGGDGDDDNDVYLKKITTRVSQNLILHKNADQPKA